MARHYSTKDSFRQMPNARLACYFHEPGLIEALDFSALKETQPDEMLKAWLTVPDGQRNEIDAEFREIFELSCEPKARFTPTEIHQRRLFAKACPDPVLRYRSNSTARRSS